MTTLYTLPNTVGQATEPRTLDEIAAFKDALPQGVDKEGFRAWSNSASTQSLFYSGYVGLNPKLRISKANPAVKMTALIGDYDSEKAADSLQRLEESVSHLPTWASYTFSPGKVRLVWEFETPLSVLNEELAERTLQILDSKIRYSKAAPLYDKSSTAPNQVFHVGRAWGRVEGGKPIPTDVLESCVLEAGLSLAKKLTSGDIQIPISAVAEEIERQFPARISGEIAVGTRVPLFWIADGIDRIGGVIVDNGVVCFSDRAGRNFLPWRDILGAKFVDEFKASTIGAAAAKFYYDGKFYYAKTSKGWRPITREDARLHIKASGVSDDKRRGQNLTDVESVLYHIQTNRRVAGAAPVLFKDNDIEEINGVEYLNLNEKFALPPAPAGEGRPENFPWLHGWINNAFDDGTAEENQARDHFLAWFKHAYQSALKKDLQPGQVAVLVGGVHTGKSFFSRWVVGHALGGSYNATDILLKSSAFNKGAGEVAVWRVDDAPTDGDWKTKRAFTQALKEFAANPTLLWQPKFRDAVELPFLGRVILTMNSDPESLALLPAIDGSFADKISLFVIRNDFHPIFLETNSANEARAIRELPYFLRWLLDWQVPDHILNRSKPRYGVKPFHHSELVAEAHAESLEYGVQELMEPWIIAKSKDKDAKDTYTATELLQELKNELPSVTYQLNARNLGKSLAKLVGAWAPLEKKFLSKGITKYKFNFHLTKETASGVDQPF